MLYRIDFRAMGCRMLAMLDSSSPSAADILARIPEWYEEWEQCLSRFRIDSELSALNRSAGWPVPVSATLWEVFQAAVEAEGASAGLVRATVLEAVVKAGYDRSFDLIQSGSNRPALSWSGIPSLVEIQQDASNRSLCLPQDVHLDFGGIAKGWAAMQTAQRLSEYGAALVSAGGDIAISSSQLDGGLWPVTVDDPFNPGEIIANLGLGAGGVATSGTDRRRWNLGGRWYHHIIDPRTGSPAVTDLITVTVIAPDTAQAEMAAKTVLILGSSEGLRWIESKPQYSALFVLETGDMLCSQHMQDYFWRSK